MYINLNYTVKTHPPQANSNTQILDTKEKMINDNKYTVYHLTKQCHGRKRIITFLTSLIKTIFTLGFILLKRSERDNWEGIFTGKKTKDIAVLNAKGNKTSQIISQVFLKRESTNSTTTNLETITPINQPEVLHKKQDNEPKIELPEKNEKESKNEISMPKPEKIEVPEVNKADKVRVSEGPSEQEILEMMTHLLRRSSINMDAFKQTAETILSTCVSVENADISSGEKSPTARKFNPLKSNFARNYPAIREAFLYLILTNKIGSYGMGRGSIFYFETDPTKTALNIMLSNIENKETLLKKYEKYVRLTAQLLNQTNPTDVSEETIFPIISQRFKPVMNSATNLFTTFKPVIEFILKHCEVATESEFKQEVSETVWKLKFSDYKLDNSNPHDTLRAAFTYLAVTNKIGCFRDNGITIYFETDVTKTADIDLKTGYGTKNKKSILEDFEKSKQK